MYEEASYCIMSLFPVVRALVPRMTLDELFEQKGEVAKAVLEELEKVSCVFLFQLPLVEFDVYQDVEIAELQAYSVSCTNCSSILRPMILDCFAHICHELHVLDSYYILN